MDPRDEFFHRPTAEPYWSESHYLDLIDPAADIDFHGRIGFYPNQGTVPVFAYVRTGDDVYWVRDETVPAAAAHGLHVDGGEWTMSLEPVELGGRWDVQLSGTVTHTPLEVFEGEPAPAGDPATVDLELVSHTRHDPFYYTDGQTFPSTGSADRYEVAIEARGSVTVGEAETDIQGYGERDHSWGERRWAGPAEWLWICGALEDGCAYNHLTFWLAEHPSTRWINGFWYDGESVWPLTDATVTASPPFGQEVTEAWMAGETRPSIEMEFEWEEGTRTLSVAPGWTTTIDWCDEESASRGVLNRAPSTQRAGDGTVGTGFLENMGQLPL